MFIDLDMYMYTYVFIFPWLSWEFWTGAAFKEMLTYSNEYVILTLNNDYMAL